MGLSKEYDSILEAAWDRRYAESRAIAEKLRAEKTAQPVGDTVLEATAEIIPVEEVPTTLF